MYISKATLWHKVVRNKFAFLHNYQYTTHNDNYIKNHWHSLRISVHNDDVNIWYCHHLHEWQFQNASTNSKLLICIWEILCHSFWSAYTSSANVWRWVLKMSHKCSIGVTSRLLGGHGRESISLCSRYSLTAHDL